MAWGLWEETLVMLGVHALLTNCTDHVSDNYIS